MEATRHIPVLLKEVLDYLQCQPGRIYIDGTIGSGGHARAILERSSPSGRLVGLDWDEEALTRARVNLASFGERVELRKINFKELGTVLESLAIPAVDGILLDLGLSTEQLENEERGFSFRLDGPLDMRMSQETRMTARDLLQRLSVAELNQAIGQFGEERWARRIAQAIGRSREKEPIRRTSDLARIVVKAVRRARGRIHPATRTFQALRIFVNQELDNLKDFLAHGHEFLNPGGRLCIIAFHSLEDRIVKENFRHLAQGKDAPFLQILTRKPIRPSVEEVQANPQARSAKLRVAEKLPAGLKGDLYGRSDL